MPFVELIPVKLQPSTNIRPISFVRGSRLRIRDVGALRSQHKFCVIERVFICFFLFLISGGGIWNLGGDEGKIDSLFISFKLCREFMA